MRGISVCPIIVRELLACHIFFYADGRRSLFEPRAVRRLMKETADFPASESHMTRRPLSAPAARIIKPYPFEPAKIFVQTQRRMVLARYQLGLGRRSLYSV
ncbi:hypothetical protein [Chelativorans sp. M5D2P16]|uniref:hypothetical protein n=1 Tax=Chelativorans sp. M5D2P16 TaxID=3095678 RepID=UPI002ACA54F4|nr:hypothetical protein [Chelativorans sp. M5D2P16]MDZ5697839.1 hypothetical protein [Chelativorans sp. M5D2P16]